MSVTSQEQRNRMLQEPAGKLLFRMALPTVITQLITIFYNTADTFFVSRISTEASAAVGVVFSLMALIQAVGFGIGMGCGSIISRCLGAGKEKDAFRYASSAVAAGALFGLVIMTCGFLFLHPFLGLLGASRNVLPYASDYASYILIAAPFMCTAFVLNNILKAEGQTMLSMIGMTAGSILNILLDPLFIFSFHMGIHGAAAATMTGQLVSLLILSWFFLSGKSIVKLHPRYISRNGRDYLRIIRTGAPTILRQGLSSLAAAVLNNQAVVYGDSAVAAISITNKIYMLGRNTVLGIGHGYMPIAGYCFGAGKMQRVRKLFLITTAAGTTVVLLIAAAVFPFRETIMSWFRQDADVIRVGSECLLFSCISTPFLAYSTYVNQTYQCLGFAAGATFLASLRQGLFFLPLAFLLPGVLGLTGIEMVQPAADILTFLLAIPFQLRFFRKHLPVHAP